MESDWRQSNHFMKLANLAVLESVFFREKDFSEWVGVSDIMLYRQ